MEISAFSLGVNGALVAGFVNTSSIICSVGQYSKVTLSLFTVSLMKWYLISICLHLCLLTGFLASAIVPWLSSYTFVCVYLYLSMPSSSCSK